MATHPSMTHRVLLEANDAWGIERGLLHRAGNLIHGFGSAADGVRMSVRGIVPFEMAASSI